VLKAVQDTIIEYTFINRYVYILGLRKYYAYYNIRKKKNILLFYIKSHGLVVMSLNHDIHNYLYYINSQIHYDDLSFEINFALH